MKSIYFLSTTLIAIFAICLQAGIASACDYSTQDEKERAEGYNEHLVYGSDLPTGIKYVRYRNSHPYISVVLYNQDSPYEGKMVINTDSPKGKIRRKILFQLHGKGGGLVFVTAEATDSNCYLDGPTADVIDEIRWSYLLTEQ